MIFRFGASYYPLHRDRSTWADDLKLMQAAHFNALRIGDFSWCRLEPCDNQWDFHWLDEYLDLAQAHDIGILLIPPIRCAPAWLVEMDPSIQIINEFGVRLAFGSRYTFCINHPLFVTKGLEVTRQIASRYATHPAVIGWHLDNEYGDEPDCHCEYCQKLWHQWLQERYGCIDSLNRAWGTIFWSLEYTKFTQIPTPALSKTYHQPAHRLAWRRFRSQCTVDLMRMQKDMVRRYDRNRPVTSNLQCLWNPRTDYFGLHDILDVTGMNYYPPYGEKGRDSALGIAVVRSAVGPGMEIHELRNSAHAVPGKTNNSPGPGEIERLTLHCIAHGADAVYYFQWAGVRFGIEQTHGTIVDYDGKPKRAYAQCARIGERLKKLAPSLAGTTVKSEVAVVYDFNTRWLLQCGREWMAPEHLYLHHSQLLYNTVRQLGVNCDATGREHDWSKYKILIVPILDAIDDTMVSRLIEYVEAGGNVLWHPLSGIRNLDAEIYPTRLHPQLEKLFGLSIREYATAGEGESRPFVLNNQSYAGTWFMDLPEPTTAQTLAHYHDGWLAGTPAVCVNHVGKGKAVYCATFAEAAFYRVFMEQLCRDAGVEPILKTPPPSAIEVTQRIGTDGRRLIFMINTTAAPQTMLLPKSMSMDDLWNDQPLAGQIQFDPWQVRIGLLK